MTTTVRLIMTMVMMMMRTRYNGFYRDQCTMCTRNPNRIYKNIINVNYVKEFLKAK